MLRYMIVLICTLILMNGCSNNEASTTQYDKKYQQQVEEYDEQLKFGKEQMEVYERQTKKAEEQQQRMEKLLDRWEKQADRYDAILSKWESQK